MNLGTTFFTFQCPFVITSDSLLIKLLGILFLPYNKKKQVYVLSNTLYVNGGNINSYSKIDYTLFFYCEVKIKLLK